MYISVKVSVKTVNAEKRFIYHQHNWLPYAISHILLHVLLMLGHESVRVRTNYLAMKEVDVDGHNFCPTDTKLDQERRQPESTLTYSLELPPPLPPRPGRGNVVYPNKPLVRPTVRMKALDWNRIILQRPGKTRASTLLSVPSPGTEHLACFWEWTYIDLIYSFLSGDELDRVPTTSTIWHSMLEPKIDNEEVERFVMESLLKFNKSSSIQRDFDIMVFFAWYARVPIILIVRVFDFYRLFRQQDGTTSNGMSLYSDVIAQRGKTKHQVLYLRCSPGSVSV